MRASSDLVPVNSYTDTDTGHIFTCPKPYSTPEYLLSSILFSKKSRAILKNVSDVTKESLPAWCEGPTRLTCVCVCVCQSSSTTERYAQVTARQMVIQPPHLKGFGAPIEAALEHHAHSPTHLKGFGDPIEAAFERLAAFHNILDVKEAREVVA